MLIFNCTKAAEEAFTRLNKGVKISSVQAPPYKAISEDAEHTNAAEPAFQWVVHALKAQRKTVLVVMDVEHRFCLFMPPVKKGDSEDFCRQFVSQLLNQMYWLGEDLQLLTETEFQTMAEVFVAQHQQKVFYRRSDRSVMGSIKEPIWAFEDMVAELGRLPDTEHELSSFNAWINGQLRKGKDRDAYFFPDQSLFLDWYANCSQVSPAMVKEAGERFEVRRRSVFADVLNRQTGEQVVVPEDELPENVILLDNYRK